MCQSVNQLRTKSMDSVCNMYCTVMIQLTSGSGYQVPGCQLVNLYTFINCITSFTFSTPRQLVNLSTRQLVFLYQLYHLFHPFNSSSTR
jgi:hypothetical protein